MQKLLFRGVWVALAMMSLAAGVVAQRPDEKYGDPVGREIPTPLKIVAVDEKSAPPGWKRYQVGEPFIFSAIFPRQPDAESARVSGSDGSMIVRSYIAPSEAAVYGVIYSTDLPGAVEVKTPEQKKKAFDNFMRGFADGVLGIEKGKENPQYKVIADRQVRVGSLDGYEKEFVLGNFRGRAQATFMGPDRVAIITLWHEGTNVKEQTAFERARTAFFNSLTLNPRR